MNIKLVNRFCVINYIKLLCVASSIFFFAACDPLEPATESLYTVHFDLNGVVGATPDTQIIHEGEFAEHPYVAVDDRGSHGKFAAIEWYQNKDGSGPAFQFASTPITSSYWLYAKWTNDFRTVTFEPNYTGAKPFFRHVGTGKTVEKPFDAIRANYRFDAWHKADTSSFDFSNTAIDDDIVLYAHWIQAAYTVQFDLNGAESTPPPDQSIAISQQNQNLAIEPATPTREGFTFIGWLSDTVDSVVFDFATTPISEDTTLYAGWQSEYTFGFQGREYAAVMDDDTFLLNVGKTYTQINDQKVRLVRVPVGFTTKPAEGTEIQLSKSWGSFEANGSSQSIDYKVKVFLEPTIKAELKAIVDSAIAKEGNNVDLNFVETHQITDMRKLFFMLSDFNGDISKWNTSKVTNMSYMFFYAEAFNSDLSKWDISKVTNMEYMFVNAEVFNSDLSEWDTSNVTNMEAVFLSTKVFNGDIFKWNTSNVKNMGAMFQSTKVFNGDISKWDTSSVTNMSYMFARNNVFNGDISKWDTSSVKYIEYMFSDTEAFNQDISKWNTSNVTSMRGMFLDTAKFNQDLSKWNTSNVTSMQGMFAGAQVFNTDISKWNTSNVTDMIGMFAGTEAFNQNISKWNTSKVKDMSAMFRNNKVFNGDISKWDTSHVADMNRMFENTAEFNQDISNWDTSSVTNMSYMFYSSTKFYQDISGWNVNNVTDWTHFINAASALRKYQDIPRKFRSKHFF